MGTFQDTKDFLQAVRLLTPESSVLVSLPPLSVRVCVRVWVSVCVCACVCPMRAFLCMRVRIQALSWEYPPPANRPRVPRGPRNARGGGESARRRRHGGILGLFVGAFARKRGDIEKRH